MKKYLLVAGIAAALIACGGNTNEKKENADASTSSSTAAADDKSKNPDYQKGLELIAKNDCLTCHKVSEKLIGPSYQEVAAKYENNEENVKHLADKVIKGGQGVWGQVPMTPHAGVSQADAEQMIKYVLLLKAK
ncbi:MAG: c-type cytochrome [Filimonas sp.]|nr:c-type cytochrome [Filimonas sp.]